MGAPTILIVFLTHMGRKISIVEGLITFKIQLFLCSSALNLWLIEIWF
jgi:hypothetical protein